jgi:hypothetical protein
MMPHPIILTLALVWPYLKSFAQRNATQRNALHLRHLLLLGLVSRGPHVQWPINFLRGQFFKFLALDRPKYSAVHVVF